MNSLVIVVALVTAACVDAARLGNNYVAPAIKNNKLQDTYILPATKSQSTYVALPVSILDTYNPSKLVEVSQNKVVSPTFQIKSNVVQLPESISSALTKSTQKIIQNNVQNIIKKTVSSNTSRKSSQLSPIAYLPPRSETKTYHEHLPELIDTPPQAIRGKVNALSRAATDKVTKSIDSSSSLKTKSAEARAPGVINASTSTKTSEKTTQNTLNVAVKPVEVSQRIDISSSSNTRAGNVKLSDIVHSYKPTNTIQNPENIPVKVSQNSDTSQSSKTKPSEVHLPKAPGNIKTTPSNSTPPKPIGRSLETSAKAVKVSQINDISSPSKIKVTDVNLPVKIPIQKNIQKTVNILPEPVRVLQSTAIYSTLKTKSTEVQLPQLIDTSRTSKTIQKTLNTQPASFQVNQPRTETSSTLNSKSAVVNTPIPPTSVQVSKNTDTSSILKTKSFEVKTVNTPNPPASVQASQRIDTSSNLKTKSSGVNLSQSINASTPTKNVPKTVKVPSELVQVTQRIDTSSDLKIKSSQVQSSQQINKNTSLPTKTTKETAIFPILLRPQVLKSAEQTTRPPATYSASHSVLQGTDTFSTLKTKSSAVKTVNTPTPPTSVQASQRIDASSNLKIKSSGDNLPQSINTFTPTKNVPNTDKIPSELVPVTQRIGTYSNLKIKSSSQVHPSQQIEENTVLPTKTIEETAIFSNPLRPQVLKSAEPQTTRPSVQVTQRIDTSSNLKIKSSSQVHPSQQIDKNTILPTKTVEETAIFSTPLRPQVLKVATQTTRPPATYAASHSFLHLPKVIDIVQKTIKTSVNSNIKSKAVHVPEITTENYYLPPDRK